MSSVLHPNRPARDGASAISLAAAAMTLAAAFALAGCEGGTVSTGVPCSTTKAPVGGLDYTLGVGDKLKVTIVGQPELGAEAEVDAGGKIVLALAGEITAVNRTVSEIQADITSRLRSNILVDPRVSVQVSGYRPITVLGQVRQPGRYPFSFGLDLRGAAALAGGYERRASPDRAVIFRTSGTCDARPDTPLYPGDTIEVLRRGA